MVSTPPPPLGSDDVAALDELADRMLAEAASKTDARIFSATGFAKHNISIVHQQNRCANLAWALNWRKRVGPGDVVAIVGGSFSGLMLAVSLALTSNAIVYILEKEDRLLPRFRDKGNRHLSPLLNSRDLGSGFDPDFSEPTYRSPIFAWKKGRASDVASQWLHEFESYARVLPIFVIDRCEIRREDIVTAGERLEIKPDFRKLLLFPIVVDLLIDATGFGEEQNPHNLVDHSYWESGHRLIYDHLISPAEVLVSGCGDSGVIEGLHYAISGFLHEEVEALWPAYDELGLLLDQKLENARLDEVLRSDEADRFENPVISEITWWCDRSGYEHHHPMGRQVIDWAPHARPILEALKAALAPYLDAAFPGRSHDSLSWEERETFAESMPMADQLRVRSAVQSVIDEWISLRVHEMMQDFVLPPETAELHARARPGVRITMNGETPTPYTRALSPFNVWMMCLLESFEAVDYRQGRIERVVARDDRRFDVHFADGVVRTFDRVMTRYGASGRLSVTEGALRDGQAGDWLLSRPSYVVPDPDDPKRGRRVYPAEAAIRTARERLWPQPEIDLATDIRKQSYLMCLLQGVGSSSPGTVSQADLSAAIRAGGRLTYASDAIFEEAWMRAPDL
ncbi:MAG: hypothetical protein P0Y64_05675 [Candidatus Sphingomonas colombiensis]|nr:hypothetical protein [Sphingomonas sp.]WEK44297.1 MAG: hypothetical protein P0Y64_05675 [Sphingomonas sp.]